MDAPLEITALTLNCWGLKYISALRAERFPEIGRRIAKLATSPASTGAADAANLSNDPSFPRPSPPLSIVALQECWCYEDFATIHKLTRHVLPYAKFFHSGVWGAGLAVLSRWPITQTSMYTYPLGGRPTAFWRGDWFVGKGIASATIRVGDAATPATPTTTVEVLVTHTHASYESSKQHDSYLVHQLSQTWEMGKRMRAAAERGRLVLAMGDFNMLPDSLPYNALLLGAVSGDESTASLSGGNSDSALNSTVHDTWRELHPDSSLGPSHLPAEKARKRPMPGAVFNLEENGATSDNVYNTWRWPKDKRERLHKSYRQRQQNQNQNGHAAVEEPDSEFYIAPDTPDPRAKRLDYIFYAQPMSNSRPSGPVWKTKTAHVAMVEPHPTVGCSVSDHFALQVTLTCVHGKEPTAKNAHISPYPNPEYVKQEGSEYAATIISMLDRFVAETDKYMVREQKQKYWRCAHFFAAVATTIGCYVAVWFSPRPFVAFLLTLLASLGLAAGIVDGLIGLLFFGSEMRYLREFHWEIRNSRAAITSVRIPSPHAEDKASSM